MSARTRIEEALGLAPGSIGTTEKVQVACAALSAGRPADQVRLEELFGLDFGALAASAPPLTCPAPLKAPMLAPAAASAIYASMLGGSITTFENAADLARMLKGR